MVQKDLHRITPRRKSGQGRGRRSFNGMALDIPTAAEFIGCTDKTLRARVARRTVPFRKFQGRII